MAEKIDIYDVVVIGGGPAGVMSAITAAKCGEKVLLLEKNQEILKKLLLTGNSRCNIMNAEFNLRKLVDNYGKNGNFLFHAFSIFGPKETFSWLEDAGVRLKTEANQRVFPVLESAKAVRTVLENRLKSNGVTVMLSVAVKKISVKGIKKKKIEKIVLSDGKEIKANKYIFCAGGASYPGTGSDGSGYKMIESLGHTINPLLPALVPVKIKEDWVKELQGVSLKEVKITVLQNNKKLTFEVGDLMFTHFGVSGPVILNLSRKIGEALENGEVKISADLNPHLNTEQLEINIDEYFKRFPKRNLANCLNEFMPRKMVLAFVKIFNINSNVMVNGVRREERQKIARLLKNLEMTAEGLLDFNAAMVTSGGVSVKEIDHKTMQSKIIENLFFAGEIIDVDGKTGGFNLQLCWSTGHLAGEKKS